MRSMALAQCDTKTNVPDAEGQVALAAVDGAVYGLDAANGRVLWRRFVGFDANPQAPAFPPTPLSAEPGSDALVVDTAHNELLRIEGHGPRPVAACRRRAVRRPSRHRRRKYPGRHASGQADHHRRRLGRVAGLRAVSPGAPRRPGHRFPAIAGLPGRRTHQRLHPFADRRRLQTRRLPGTRAGKRHHGAGDGRRLSAGGRQRRRPRRLLQVFAIEPNGSDKPGPWLKPVQQIRLDGHLQMSPLVEGGRVLVATNSGVVRVFELSATNAKTPLRNVADLAIEGGPDLTRFALMQNGQFWIADNRLTKYDVQAARGRLMPKWIDNEDSAFLQPPVAFGQAVVSVRRKLGMPGAIVSAVAMQDSGEIWETQIASPLAGQPIVPVADGKETAQGRRRHRQWRRVPDRCERKGPAVVNTPIVTSDPFRIPQPLTTWSGLPGGSWRSAAAAAAIRSASSIPPTHAFDVLAEDARQRWLVPRRPSAADC